MNRFLSAALVASAMLPSFAHAQANPEGPALRRTLPDTVRVERDIVYATYGDREVMLDLYLPKEPTSDKIPCIVVIHGGGWRSGDKTRHASQAAYLAERRFAAACIGYRLLPEVTFPAPVVDCKAAVRWVRANASKHGIDADRIGATGGSAGGHLTAMLAASFKVQELEGDGGNPGISSRIQAAVAMAAPGDMTAYAQRTGADPEMAALISPMTHIDADAAPMLLIHSTDDRTVPIAQSEAMLAKYKELGLTTDLVKIPNGGHAFWNSPQWFPDVMEQTARFFHEQLK